MAASCTRGESAWQRRSSGPMWAPSGNFEKLRSVINEKNAEWHARYRTVDGYNVYGGRSALAYQPGKGPFISNREAPEPYVSNYKVMQEEMTQRDVKTANRDRRVWAVVKGGDLKVDDSNLPPVTKVESNKAHWEGRADDCRDRSGSGL